MKRLILAAVIATLGSVGVAQAGDTPAPANAKVYFVNLKDGATVKSPVKVIFGLSGMGVAPAGTEKAKTGHHHLFIDRPTLGKGPDGADELEANIPSDEKHRCSIPDDHIDPRRSALFMARSVLRDIRDGGANACSTS